MIILNLQNIENLIFYNDKMQSLLPEYKHLFDSWKLSTKHPFLRNLGKRSIVDFMNSLTESNIAILSKYFGDTIKIEDIDYHIVKHTAQSINELHLEDTFLNVVLYRNKDQLYISSWR